MALSFLPLPAGAFGLRWRTRPAHSRHASATHYATHYAPPRPYSSALSASVSGFNLLTRFLLYLAWMLNRWLFALSYEGNAAFANFIRSSFGTRETRSTTKYLKKG